MKTNSDIANRFIERVDREATRLSVQLLFGYGKTVLSCDDRTPTDGYFNAPSGEESGIIAVAAAQPQTRMLHTLAHEYAHMWQWFHDDSLWTTWQRRSTPANYYALEVYTEQQACEIIEAYSLPCGDHKKRARKYLEGLRKDLGV